jgi:hypothetical protein
MDFVIASIIKILKRKEKTVGKIQIQKFVYFLKAMRIRVPYSFEISHYGPYSAALSRKLEEMEFDGLIDKNDNKGIDYIISDDKSISYEIEKNPQLYTEIEDKIEKVLNILPELDFNSLELYSTVHYCYNTLKLMAKEEDISNEDLFNEVKRWKGEKFQKEQIIGAFQRMKEGGLLQTE